MSIMRMPCPECEDTKIVGLVCLNEKVTIKGIEVLYKSKSYRCFECRELFDTCETMQANLDSARESYSRQIGAA
jgi:hypothetical protein